MAEVLYRSMWLENWGSGARRIMEACEEQGVEEPTWRWDGGFVYVTFKRPAKGLSVDTVNNNPESNDECKGGKYGPSTTQVRRMIILMDDDYMSLRDIMALFNLNSAKRFRENYINPGITDGALARLYPDQPHYPKQQYRLTEAAKEWKSNAKQ